MKRKAEDEPAEEPLRKKPPRGLNGSSHFREGLLQQASEYHDQYLISEPYQHGVIHNLLDSQLLRKVRTEIQDNLSFTPKETDIYKIYQSGDLANLDGLEDSSLKRLPSLLTLRDTLYSAAFRDFLSTVTGSGPLSGKKTDMAINVYTPSCHLLCHDDVIGSRRVSYILYLTDPDRPWKPEWGGALRLYPTIVHKDKDGKEVKVPSPDYSGSIPPAFNQLSFFAVQPGESFHDVEEVYAKQKDSKEADDESDEARVRMAISGWYHIPQQGEDGFVKGLEESLAERSSLHQLQGSGDQYDKPLPAVRQYDNNDSRREEGEEKTGGEDEDPLTQEDLEFLLKYMAPTYLTPDTLESVSATFGDECSICLEEFLSSKFSTSLKANIEKQESEILPSTSEDIEKAGPWGVARPPHKHRFLFQQASGTESAGDSVDSPIQELLCNLLPSRAFRKWLQLATGLTLSSHDLLARRFRRGKDYTLATGYTGDESQLEIVLSITPSSGWSGDEDPGVKDGNSGAKQAEIAAESNDKELSKEQIPNAEEGKDKEPPKDQVSSIEDGKDKEPPKDQVPDAEEGKDKEPAKDQIPDTEEAGFGGYIAYMASDDADDASSDTGSNDGVEVPLDLSTGGRASKPSTQKPKPKLNKADPAVYQAATDEEDDGVLFSIQPSWNTLGLVLRDKGVMRFTKYVSCKARGDRWDVLGEFGVIFGDDGNDGSSGVEGDKEEDEEAERLVSSQQPEMTFEHTESETEIESSESD
ncbi:MAG: hypothetical protein L6R37_004580 [Teloschistes peruensis]|nr:MAG: hypothetical protein L6R37_004580 [Teloschistes peruensis]